MYMCGALVLQVGVTLQTVHARLPIYEETTRAIDVNVRQLLSGRQKGKSLRIVSQIKDDGGTEDSNYIHMYTQHTG